MKRDVCMKNRKKHIRKRILSIVLSLAMVITSIVWTKPQEAKAANFNNSMSGFEVYPSGCLKSMVITIHAVGTYATAYGKIAIHTQQSKYDWNNRWTYNGNASWPDSIENDGFVVWGEGAEFLWSDGKSYEINVSFNDGVVNLKEDKTYYVYLWTRATSYGIYPDALVYTLKTSGGKLTDSSGNTLVEAANHNHKWCYTADNNNIQAYCTETTDAAGNCYYQGASNAVTMSLNASNVAYSGNQYSGAGFDSKEQIKNDRTECEGL
ncbi:MAG: hypothetical protein MR409_06520 [Lachnospiraceae bacterium]|nr:hypothetical protein [Lachnospiraceae bacterium]